MAESECLIHSLLLNDYRVWIKLIRKSGEVITRLVHRDIAESLKSSNTDPEVKALLWQTLTSNNNEGSMLTNNNNEGSMLTNNNEDPNNNKDEQPGCSTSGHVCTNAREDSSMQWTPSAEKLVLNKHKELEESNIPIKNKWKKKQKKNEKSGESPGTEDELELDDVFDKFPDMNPEFSIDSSSSSKKGPTKRKESSSPESDSSSSVVNDKAKSAKRPRRGVDVITDYFGDVLQKREDAAERRHKERIETMNSLVEVMKQVANKKKKIDKTDTNEDGICCRVGCGLWNDWNDCSCCHSDNMSDVPEAETSHVFVTLWI
ncbi:unnamed protein product [Mytilus edulis]|uniref:Uncharacterized protein n=1 Tax=Mytilus edulis TaxID=6550 RepID=A0A8S3R259_MYTED|nr:unnamed protein product [Mytilus edulis]